MSGDQSKFFNPLVIPLLFLLSSRPEYDQKLGQMVSIIEAIQTTVRTLRSGLENFHYSMMQMAGMTDPGQLPNTNISSGKTT